MTVVESLTSFHFIFHGRQRPINSLHSPTLLLLHVDFAFAYIALHGATKSEKSPPPIFPSNDDEQRDLKKSFDQLETFIEERPRRHKAGRPSQPQQKYSPSLQTLFTRVNIDDKKFIISHNTTSSSTLYVYIWEFIYYEVSFKPDIYIFIFI